MTQSPPYPDPASEPSSRERIDALLDEALAESFPASDSSAIGSGVAAIKRKHREPRSGKRSANESRPKTRANPRQSHTFGAIT